MIPDYNKQGPNTLREVRIGYWHSEASKLDKTTGDYTPRIHEVRFKPDAPEGLLHGFASETVGEETYVVALVELPDGMFTTPAISVIMIIS